MIMEAESEKSLPEYMRKSSPTPFMLKTYMLVEDSSTDDVISWNPEGTAFIIWQPEEFARDLLPTLFNHSNADFSSFVRQLNIYGFRKVATTGRWEFSNNMFRKGKRDLLCKLRPRKCTKNHQHLHQAAAAAAANNNIDAVVPKDHHQSDNEDQSQRSSSLSHQAGISSIPSRSSEQ